MGIVAYARIGHGGNQVIFSGITTDGLSTVDAAKRIIRAISCRECIGNPRHIVWCDLQAQRGYPYFAPGEYRFTQLVLSGSMHNFEVTAWIPSAPSQYILELFAAYIGPNPRPRP